MPKSEFHKPPQHLPFQLEMVISFLGAARVSLDPVLQAIDGYREPEIDHDGRPAAPNHVARKLAELPIGDMFHYVGACLSATTNLGLAYIHSFRLLSLLTQGKDPLPSGTAKPHLAKLYDALPSNIRRALCGTYDQVPAQDFELMMGTDLASQEPRDEDLSVGRGFRSALVHWQSRGMLQDSHLYLAGASRESVIRIFIPLRCVLVLDRILADHIAPRLGREYRTMDLEMSSRTENPVLEWDGKTIFVSLPDKLGRVVEARWNPSVTSVVRVREVGTEAWSIGFETPFNMCSFVDIKPDTEYEVQVTHKNDAGESDPAIVPMRSGPSTE